MAARGQDIVADGVRLRAWTDFVLSYNRLMAVLEREMQEGAGITLSQYDVLLRLAEAPGRRLKMSDLADAVLYSTGGLTRLFERMRQAGLVRREPSREDRRVIYAVATDDGMERLRAASAVHLDGVREHFAAFLTDDEAGAVSAFLGRLHDSLLACGQPSAGGGGPSVAGGTPAGRSAAEG
jgi:DNA-binding MarR family transcriptional regulator